MFDGLLKSKFYNKCKLATSMTQSRLEIIKKKRNAMHKYLKNDIADLLRNGLEKNAYDRAEGYLVEQNLTSCYELVEKFCSEILNNVSMMSKQSECPQDCNEAVASLIFAAARFADLPDLRDLRSLFTNRYGTSLESYVHKEFVNKMQLVPPTQEMKFQLMQDIAVELGLQFNRKTAEEKHFKQLNDRATNAEFHLGDVVDSRKNPERKTPFRSFPREEKKIAKGNVEDNELLQRKPIPQPPYRRSNVDQISINNEGDSKKVKDSPVQNSKPRPVSVRGRPSKLNNYNDDGVGVSSARKEDRHSNHNEPDEEERLLDKMLLRHTLKKSTLGETGSDQKSGLVRHHGRCDVGTSKEATKRAPDYDDLVARIAAFK